MKEKTVAKFREEIVKDAKQEVRRQLRAEILDHELAKYKIQLEKEVEEKLKRWFLWCGRMIDSLPTSEASIYQS